MKVLIVGGVAGGASAAARLRRMDEHAEIIMFEKGEYVSYANCGLPYYIGNVITDKEKLVVTKPELLRERFNIDVRTNSEVISIDTVKKVVRVKESTGKSYQESYDKLILSPGASPIKPNIKGIESSGVFSLRNIPDTYKIYDYITENNCENAIVVGGGFIGVEIAENLKERGLSVSLVEFANQILTFLDKDMAKIVQQSLKDNGVNLLLEKAVTEILPLDKGLSVVLNNGDTLNADMVIMAVGVNPDSKLAIDAGIKVGQRGAIIVDENFETSAKDVYAVGDAIETINFITGESGVLPLAGPANKQGRMVADVIAGAKRANKKAHTVQGTSILKVFDMTAGSTGLNEKQLKAAGIEYHKVYIHPLNHASYYPGATQINMKMLFQQDGKILGVQAVGYQGVDKRIDVMSTVMRLGGTVYDLEDLELAYAPPYSSAKDPVNMLGYTASNILVGDTKVFNVSDISSLDLDKVQLLDVRTPMEFIRTIDGAINIPVDDLRDNLDKLDKSRPVYIFCRVGLRGYIADRILTQHGFDVYNLTGGYISYSQSLDEIEKNRSTIDCVGVNHYQDCIIKDNEKDNDKENDKEDNNMNEEIKTHKIDAVGLQCPGPIMKVYEGIKSIAEGERVEIVATDPGFISDVEVWCERTGNPLISIQKEGTNYHVIIQKGGGEASGCPVSSGGNDKTMVVFSGDLDKAIAAFIIANGAAAMNRKVTLFFTFWGLNILRKTEKVATKKNIVERMFGMMMPRGSKKLGMSRMNMGGMGAKMIRQVMKGKNVQSLEELIESAISQGVRIVACQMSMDVMGIKPEELIKGVEIGGVATFLGAAENADTNLFI